MNSSHDWRHSAHHSRNARTGLIVIELVVERLILETNMLWSSLKTKVFMSMARGLLPEQWLKGNNTEQRWLWTICLLSLGILVWPSKSIHWNGLKLCIRTANESTFILSNKKREKIFLEIFRKYPFFSQKKKEECHEFENKKMWIFLSFSSLAQSIKHWLQIIVQLSACFSLSSPP